MKETIVQIVGIGIGLVPLVAAVVALSMVIGGLFGAVVALSYNMVFAASFELLPAAYTGSIVSIAAGGIAAGSSASS